MKKIIRFCLPEGEFWFLSPYSSHPIKMIIDEKEFIFPTVEHYYQAMKFETNNQRFFDILSLSNPNDARLLTKKKKYKNNRRKNFEQDKFSIMKAGLIAKFSQNLDARNLLISTGDALLLKSCPICYKCGFGEGSGQNELGKILMEIRDCIKQKNETMSENQKYTSSQI